MSVSPQPDNPNRDQDAVPRNLRAELALSAELMEAYVSGVEALAGDSNDQEHDALDALVAALAEFNLVEWSTYDPSEIIQDFYQWAGLDPNDVPDYDDIEEYAKVARPANSNPLDVREVLFEWADDRNTRKKQ